MTFLCGISSSFCRLHHRSCLSSRGYLRRASAAYWSLSALFPQQIAFEIFAALGHYLHTNCVLLIDSTDFLFCCFHMSACPRRLQSLIEWKWICFITIIVSRRGEKSLSDPITKLCLVLSPWHHFKPSQQRNRKKLSPGRIESQFFMIIFISIRQIHRISTPLHNLLHFSVLLLLRRVIGESWKLKKLSWKSRITSITVDNYH